MKCEVCGRDVSTGPRVVYPIYLCLSGAYRPEDLRMLADRLERYVCLPCEYAHWGKENRAHTHLC